MTAIALSPAMISNHDDFLIPQEYICPISLSVMREPVMSKDGKNFEKRAILDWLNRGNTNCPLTRQPLKPSLLVPNASLQMSIQRWRKENMVPDAESVDDDASSSSDDTSEFVGLLQIDESIPLTLKGGEVYEHDEWNSLRRFSRQAAVDEELSDLLDLYNEVLALTSMPFESFPASASREQSQPVSHISTSTQEERNAAVAAIVAHTARRQWRPKLFKKKTTT